VTPAERAVRALFDTWAAGDYTPMGDLLTDGFVDHGAPPGLVPPGPDGYIATLRFITDVLEIRYEVHQIVASGDHVALFATAHGVHNSDHLGFAATGKPYAMPTMHLFRADGGRLAEHWGVRDELSVLWQVGALPQPPLPQLEIING
jgi:predicted ester cyclase